MNGHRAPRVLFISGSIGLGHAARDLAITRELRRIRPDAEIVWLAADPARTMIAGAGETLLPEAEGLTEDTAAAEQ